MPSTIVGNPLASGAQPLISGCFWSGRAVPIGGVRLVLDFASSGNVYVGYSGNLTLTSGSHYLSGGGLNDGVALKPGGEMLVPKSQLISGQINVFLRHDAACSGVRLHYEIL